MHYANEDDSQFVTYEEDNHELDTSNLSFTPNQHKTLLALLQGSSTLPAHNVNHFITKSSSSTCILM
jgi:uncharacterized protein VirK/YbjX